jgi:predicted alpha/beta-hydrolase family hydrolase
MKSADKRSAVKIPDLDSVSCLRTGPADADWTFVYAPGAGSNLRDPFGAFAATALAARSIAMVRFQFPYMEAGRRGPDRPPVLEATWRAVIEAVRPDAQRLVIGGRSMGGRIASQVVAQGVAADALALFAYPLHPPGKPDQLRAEHLAALRVPALFCSGTRDAFASPDELRAAARGVRGSKVHLVEGADHGFAVPKASGRTRDQIWGDAVDGMCEWLGRLK